MKIDMKSIKLCVNIRAKKAKIACILLFKVNGQDLIEFLYLPNDNKLHGIKVVQQS